jgi:CcmD family protein
VSDYVVAAFAVVWFVLLVYVAVVGLRTARIAREVELLTRLVERRQDDQAH